MLKSHFRFAIRLFWKDGVYSILNILGLALGISVGIVLLLFLRYDLSYDLHHSDHQNIYRFTNYLTAEGADFNTARTARELAPLMKNDLPEIQSYVRFRTWENITVSTISEKTPVSFIEDDIVVADSNIFEVFTHPFVQGNPEGALSGPNKVVLSETIAKKYFGDENPIDQQLDIEGASRQVTGVIKDLPSNSHLYYNIILSGMTERRWYTEASQAGEAESVSEAFWNPGSYTYFVLPDNYDTTGFNAKFQEVMFEKTFGLFAKRISGNVTVSLQPLADIHFNSDLASDEPQGDKVYLYTFSIIGVIIILLASINYMNLATARSVVRTTEMAVRKVLGFDKKRLFLSVMFESVILSFLAMLLAVAVVAIVLKGTPFESLINRDLSPGLLSPVFLFGAPAIALIIGLVSGAYPAIFIPSMPVVEALKGKTAHLSSATWLRKSMIVFQFVISLFVIICTFLMDRQLTYMRAQELGFSGDNVVFIGIPNQKVREQMEVMKNEWLKNPNISQVSTSFGIPGVDMGGQVFRVEKEGEMVQQSTFAMWVGEDFLETMDLEIVDGRGWIKDSEAEHMNFIVNETAVKEFGWGEDPFSKKIRYFHGKEDAHVIGVVKDFNFESLHNKIEPIFIILDRTPGGTFFIRIKSQDIPGSLAHIENVWSDVAPNEPFEYQFLDQAFDKQYRQDEIQKALISILSYISIFISILGLIGLSAFTAGQKIKEIGVRKTLGATVTDIIVMFSMDYLKLILIALVISIPVANYLITEWLTGFAYQMEIRWWHFLIPGILVLMVGLVAVAVQSLKAARLNPATALHTD